MRNTAKEKKKRNKEFPYKKDRGSYIKLKGIERGCKIEGRKIGDLPIKK